MSDPADSPLRASIGRIEVPAQRPAEVTAFFEQAFGWSSRRVEHPGADYRSIHPPTGPALGVSASSDDIPQPLAVLDLHDTPLEEALDRIVATGGTVDLPPRRVGAYGRFARFRDPAGNLFGLWASEDS
ncbi:MAG: VOC family protein [Acidobacteriota bacterium]